MSGIVYPPGGVLFPNRRKTTDKHPDMTGNLEISKDLLKELLEAAKAGKPIKMDVSAWSKTGNSGKFLSLKASKAWEKQAATSDSFDDDIPF
jgi:hypothetical protein